MPRMDQKHTGGKMFLTAETESAYPVPKALQSAGSAHVQDAVSPDGDPKPQFPPNSVTKAQKKALRVEVLDSQSGNTVSYSFLHIERLMKQGRAYVDSEGRTFLGIPPADPECLMIRSNRGSTSIGDVLAPAIRHLPWQPCYRTTKAPVWPWWKDQRTPFGEIGRK